MPSVIWIITVIVLLIGFFGTIFSALFFTDPIDQNKFSFMRVFPFESRKSEKNGRFYNYFLYLFSGMSFSSILVVVGPTGSLKNLNGLSILISCLFGLSALCFLFLNILDVTHVKQHLSLFTIFAMLTLLSCLLVFVRGLSAYKIFLKHGNEENLFLVTEILAAIPVVFILTIILNPKLLTWAKLDKIEGQENAYVRPKKFPLAYSEWGILLALFLGEIIYFIQLLVK